MSPLHFLPFLLVLLAVHREVVDCQDVVQLQEDRLPGLGCLRARLLRHVPLRCCVAPSLGEACPVRCDAQHRAQCRGTPAQQVLEWERLGYSLDRCRAYPCILALSGTASSRDDCRTRLRTCTTLCSLTARQTSMLRIRLGSAGSRSNRAGAHGSARSPGVTTTRAYVLVILPPFEPVLTICAGSGSSSPCGRLAITGSTVARMRLPTMCGACVAFRDCRWLIRA